MSELHIAAKVFGVSALAVLALTGCATESDPQTSTSVTCTDLQLRPQANGVYDVNIRWRQTGPSAAEYMQFLYSDGLQTTEFQISDITADTQILTLHKSHDIGAFKPFVTAVIYDSIGATAQCPAKNITDK